MQPKSVVGVRAGGLVFNLNGLVGGTGYFVGVIFKC